MLRTKSRDLIKVQIPKTLMVRLMNKLIYKHEILVVMWGNGAQGTLGSTVWGHLLSILAYMRTYKKQ